VFPAAWSFCCADPEDAEAAKMTMPITPRLNTDRRRAVDCSPDDAENMFIIIRANTMGDNLLNVPVPADQNPLFTGNLLSAA